MTANEINTWYASFRKFSVSRANYWRPKIYKNLQAMISNATNEPDITTAIRKLDESMLRASGIMETIMNVYTDAGRIFGGMAYQMVKKQGDKLQAAASGKKSYMPIGYNEELVAEIIAYFRLNLLSKAVLPITDTMKAWILRNLIEAQENGLSITDVAEEMIKADFPKNRSYIIARTETIKAANFGAVQGVKKTGFETEKLWIAARDIRTRRIPRDEFSHLAMHGKTVPMSVPFKVPNRNGSYDSLMQPGDPEGAKADIIQCFLPGEATSQNPLTIKKAFRSLYNGKIVTVNLASGNKFTCTVNHPILTSDGWVKAGSLQHGDKLIKSGVLNKIGIKLNVNNIPSTFEQVYNSLSVHNMVVRQSSILVDFYGDIPAGDVDIINVKRTLRDRICDMEAPGDLLNIPSGLIELDDIVNVEHSNYEGLVYTFETDNQMYDVSGIIARNCRCTVGFNVLKDAQGLPVRTV